MKVWISIFLGLALTTNAFAQPSCGEQLKDLPTTEQVEAGANDKELLSVYGFTLGTSPATTAAKIIESLDNSKSIKSQFGDDNELQVVCASEGAIGFVITGKLGKLPVYYLFKNGHYYAGPLLYTEGEPIVIKADSP